MKMIIKKKMKFKIIITIITIILRRRKMKIKNLFFIKEVNKKLIKFWKNYEDLKNFNNFDIIS